MREGPRGRPGLKSRCLVILFVLLVAVLHGDALHASFPHRSSGLLHGQPVAHRVVHLTVQGRVEDTLQAEVPVLFLHEDKYICHVTRFLLCLLQKKVDMRYMEVREIVKPWASFWILKDHVSCRSPKPIHVNPRCSKIDQVRICRQKKVSSLSTPYLCNPDEDF